MDIPFFGTLAWPFHFRQWLRVWRLVLHILVTCSPHVNKCWVTRDWPITIQHVRAQWASVVSWLACSTRSEKAARVSRDIEHILNGLEHICKFSSLIKTYDLLMCNIIKVMLYNGYSQMLRISLKTEKIFYRPPLMPAVRCWPWVYSLGLFRPYSTVRSGTVTWCEWGLWTDTWICLHYWVVIWVAG